MQVRCSKTSDVAAAGAVLSNALKRVNGLAFSLKLKVPFLAADKAAEFQSLVEDQVNFAQFDDYPCKTGSFRFYCPFITHC